MSHPGRSGFSMLRASCPCLCFKQIQARRQTQLLNVLTPRGCFCKQCETISTTWCLDTMKGHTSMQACRLCPVSGHSQQPVLTCKKKMRAHLYNYLAQQVCL